MNLDLFAAEVDELTKKYISNRIIIFNQTASWYTAYIRRLSNRKKGIYKSVRLTPTEERWVIYKAAHTFTLPP